MDELGLDNELQQLKGTYQFVADLLVQYSFKIAGALVILLIGLWLANKVSQLVARQFEKHQIDITLSNFVSNFVRILVIVMVAIVALGQLGISVTPMVAAIGAASLGAGLAIQGMLSNYAAGITIIVTRPFVVGNTITVKHVTGVVQDIFLGQTLLTNEEGEQISIPNKHIVGEILHNSFANKLVETQFTISYDTDPEQVIQSIQAILQASSQVYQEKACHVGINDFASMGFELGIRYWVPTQSYYQDKYQTNLAIYTALKQQGISISCPVKEIHLSH
ncbi:mechanosensitive ion channel family protein [Shewanella sp. Scap07]|uniref:mechanosensitive ion channel family protein n=1 Tax=Shewanella sp. Scap07 TaxID=2589987 RepID=UPI0015BD5D6A|nr:mechanosensitive ion channel family protein [Shewanella sp. Scap07]QLE87179.1 mechanosensitive ion channel family protein [Shewanella sp. Scap07]